MESRDVIVIGSGIGGLAAAAALATRGRKVLVLERHSRLGGLTQTFRRGPYSFSVGVHYIGGVGDAPGPAGEFGRLLAQLTGGSLRFAPIGPAYDLIRLPGFEFPVEAPRPAFVARLKAAFPREAANIDAYFEACDSARHAARAVFVANFAPGSMSSVLGWINAKRARRALETTVAEATGAMRDPRLVAVLCARWGDYAVPPERSPLALHATVLGSYDDGAYYPVGGPAVFADALARTIRDAGGELRTNASVKRIFAERGRVAGVVLEDGKILRSPSIISGMGALNTVHALTHGVGDAWRGKVEKLASTLSYVSLYVGFRGDIRALGASASNVWIYESEHVGRIWDRPLDDPAPGMFVSFPSLKDPAHPDALHHTAEIVVPCRWQAFERWEGGEPHYRSPLYEANKSQLAARLLAQFLQHFPRLAPAVDFHEASTPLSQAFFVGAPRGAMGGLEMSRPRLESDALRVRTPVPGLFLAGQDASSLGVQGAFMGGYMAAAALEPRLWGAVA
ncbi:MAG: phytoene desaturase family protein [Usitatibacter sp.]